MGFFNMRSENYWRLREALDPDAAEPIALPYDRLLKADLTAPRFRLTARGIQVEGKYSEAQDGFGAIIIISWTRCQVSSSDRLGKL